MCLHLGNEQVYLRSVSISRCHLEAPNLQNYSYIQFLEISHEAENSGSTNVGTSEAPRKVCIDASLLHPVAASQLVHWLSARCWGAPSSSVFQPLHTVVLPTKSISHAGHFFFQVPTKGKGTWMAQPKSTISLEETGDKPISFPANQSRGE